MKGIRNDSVSLTVALLNPTSTGMSRVSRTTVVHLCYFWSHSKQGFSFYRANIPTNKQT